MINTNFVCYHGYLSCIYWCFSCIFTFSNCSAISWPQDLKGEDWIVITNLTDKTSSLTWKPWHLRLVSVGPHPQWWKVCYEKISDLKNTVTQEKYLEKYCHLSKIMELWAFLGVTLQNSKELSPCPISTSKDCIQ